MPTYTYTTLDDPLGTPGFTGAAGINDAGQRVVATNLEEMKLKARNADLDPASSERSWRGRRGS